MRATRATAPGSPEAQTGPVGGTTSRSTARSRARSANSAATARQSSPTSTGSRRSSTPASSRDRSSSSEARFDKRRSCCWPPRRTVLASSTSRWPASKSSNNSSRLPCSEVSGVRSSWLAVATKARRASSWRTSACCIDASARARSPTSSAPSSRGGGGALTPSRASASAVRRSRPSRRESPVDSAIPSSSATPRPMTAAVRNALRTTSTALPPGSDLRTTRIRNCASALSLSLGILAGRRADRDRDAAAVLRRAGLRLACNDDLPEIPDVGVGDPAEGVQVGRRGVEQPDTGVGALRERGEDLLDVAVGRPAAARQRCLQRRSRRQGGGLDRGAALLVESILQGRQQRQRRDAERHHARRQQGQQQAGAQAHRTVPGGWSTRALVPFGDILNDPGTGSRRRAP